MTTNRQIPAGTTATPAAIWEACSIPRNKAEEVQQEHFLREKARSITIRGTGTDAQGRRFLDWSKRGCAEEFRHYL